jgi:hypothetical protein
LPAGADSNATQHGCCLSAQCLREHICVCLPSTCVPTPSYLVDHQVGALSGGLLTHGGCPGGCAFPRAAARVIDGDIRAIFADRTMMPPGPPSLPTFIPSTTT